MNNALRLVYGFLLISSISALGSDLSVPELASMEKLTPKPMAFPRPVDATRCDSSKPVVPDSPHHPAVLEVYASKDSAEADLDPWGKILVGGMILKEKRSTEGKIELYTGMVKREPGFFPDNGDWEYFVLDANRKITEQGKLAHCASCHEQQKERDFLFREPSLQLGAAQLTSGRLIVHSCRVKTHGEKLQYETIQKKNTLGYWIHTDDWAEWSVSITQPGTFEVWGWQGCGTGSGGSEVSLVAVPVPQAPGQPSSTLSFVVEETGHFQNFKKRLLGKLTLSRAGDYRLELRALKKPGVAVMDLRQLILEPVK